MLKSKLKFCKVAGIKLDGVRNMRWYISGGLLLWKWRKFVVQFCDLNFWWHSKIPFPRPWEYGNTAHVEGPHPWESRESRFLVDP